MKAGKSDHRGHAQLEVGNRNIQSVVTQNVMTKDEGGSPLSGITIEQILIQGSALWLTWVNLLRKDLGSPFLPPPWWRGF